MVKIGNYIVIQDSKTLPSVFKRILLQITAEAKCRTSTFCIFCDQKENLILEKHNKVNSIIVNSIDESFLTYELECRKKDATLPMIVLIDNIDKVGEKHLQFIDTNIKRFNKQNMWFILGQPDEKVRIKNIELFSQF